MELLQLHYFQTVARHEHMTRAAQELHIAQPALSKTIARLEQDLGTPLFDRKNRQIKLNQAGHIFLKQVDIALSALEEGKRQLADQAYLDHDSIYFATTNHKCDTELIAAFLTTHPETNLHLTEAISAKQKIDLLAKGEVDFCVTAFPISHPNIIHIPILSDKIYLAVSPEHRLATQKSIRLAELANESLITTKKGRAIRTIMDQYCKRAGFKPKIACEVDHFGVVSHFVMNGMGVAFMTNSMKEKSPSLAYLSIESPNCKLTYQLAWYKNRSLTYAAKQFQDFALNYY